MGEIQRAVTPVLLPTPTSADLTLSPDAAQLVERGVADNTRRAYTSDLAAYRRWCALVDRTPLPATPETAAEYATFLALHGAVQDDGEPRGRPAAPSSIARALSAVRAWHDESGYPDMPSLAGARKVLRGYRRQRAAQGARDGQAAALPLADLRKLVDACDPATNIGTRDRALLVLGFAIMARRSELVALDVDTDLRDDEKGVEVLIRWSKTDQDAVGLAIGVNYGAHPETCPVRLLAAWRDRLGGHGFTTGALWRPIDRHDRVAGMPGYSGSAAPDGRLSGEAVGKIVRRVGQVAHVDVSALSAHSLRAGGATAAYEAGNDLLTISRGGRWKDGSAVLLGYIRRVDKWKQNPMAGVL